MWRCRNERSRILRIHLWWWMFVFFEFDNSFFLSNYFLNTLNFALFVFWSDDGKAHTPCVFRANHFFTRKDDEDQPGELTNILQFHLLFLFKLIGIFLSEYNKKGFYRHFRAYGDIFAGRCSDFHEEECKEDFLILLRRLCILYVLHFQLCNFPSVQLLSFFFFSILWNSLHAFLP